MAENWADHFGLAKLRFVLGVETWTLFPLLERVAPEELDEALARWEKEVQPELYAQREAVREAAWQAELEAMVPEHRKRVAAAKSLHAAQVQRQKEFMHSIGVPDLSPEEVTERARRGRPNDGRRNLL